MSRQEKGPSDSLERMARCGWGEVIKYLLLHLTVYGVPHSGGAPSRQRVIAFGLAGTTLASVTALITKMHGWA